jgi:arylsulfatase A-like enzyme
VNVLVIMSDTFRRDHLAAYGDPAPWERPGQEGQPFIDTPNLDRLFAESAAFDRCYLSSYPTVPARSDLYTGRYGFPSRGWQPLESGDTILSELVAAKGYLPVMIFDTPMLATDAYNYTRGFAGWDFVRGQHADRYNVDPVVMPLPAAPHKLKSGPATQLYLRNTAFRQSEQDWMCARTMTTTMDWLDRNQSRENFVLWVDLWDPHEPFDAPEADIARYAGPDFDGDVIIYPPYGRPGYMTPEEQNHVRASYAGLVTLTDRWIGHLLDKLRETGLDRNTLVIFLSDHGHLFGDHDLQGKPTGPLGKLYETTVRCPLLIRHPDGLGAGTRVEGIVQHPDILPTILEALEIPVPDTVHGRSVWPLIRGEASDIREHAVSGRFSHLIDTGKGTSLRRPDAADFDGAAGIASPAEPLTVTTTKWAYIYAPRDREPQVLYDLESDPGQRRNVLGEHPDVAAGLQSHLLHFLETHGANAERLARYNGSAGPIDGSPLVDDQIPFFVIEDTRGVRFAYLQRTRAEAMLGPDFPDREIRETTFGALRSDPGETYVHIHDQYYWPSDLE